MQSDSGRQTGNVIVFIIVGIVLAALLAGGIYVSKQQGRVASRTDTVSVNTENDAGADEEEAAGEESAAPEQAPANTGNTNSQPVPSQSASPAAPTNNNGSSNSSQRGVPHTGPSSIASTGPVDGMLPAASLGLLTIGALSYVRSQRSFRNSALK